MSTVTNVSVGKPKIGGAIFVAPPETTLPTDATSALDPAFKQLGYASEDGLTNDNTPESDSIKAWGGDTVLVYQTSKEDTFGFTLIEALNVDVLKYIYGDENVEGTLEQGITVKANSKEARERAVVIDMMLREGALKRIVIPRAKVSEVGTITYADESAIGYETTTKCLPDEEGNTHYEYILRSSQSNSVVPVAPTYNAVTPDGTEDPSEEGWYEMVGGEYVLSEDTVVDTSKTYYTKA